MEEDCDASLVGLRFLIKGKKIKLLGKGGSMNFILAKNPCGVEHEIETMEWRKKSSEPQSGICQKGRRSPA